MRKVTVIFLTLLLCVMALRVEAGQEIRIGVVYPLTGPSASTGHVLLEGVKLAVDLINEGHNLAMPLARSEGLPNLNRARLVIVPGDHQGNAAMGFMEAERLIVKEKVVAVIGSYNSNVTATASQAAERYGVPFVNESSTSPMLTERGFKWFFRITPNDALLSENFFKFLKELKQQRNIETGPISIFHENTLFGEESAKFQEMYAKQHGYQIIGTVAYPPKSTGLTMEVKKLKSLGSGVILQTSYLADAIVSMKTYKSLNFAPHAVLANNAGFVDPEFVGTLGKDGEYILSREVWAKDLSARKPIVKAVADLFQKRTGKPMDGNSARAFTAMIVLADAINSAGSTKPALIRKALLDTDLKSEALIVPWDGVRFDPVTHQNILGKGIIVQIRDGEYRTVWPFDLATKDVVWPFPRWDKR